MGPAAAATAEASKEDDIASEAASGRSSAAARKIGAAFETDEWRRRYKVGIMTYNWLLNTKDIRKKSLIIRYI